jgi:hypothetical protein
VTSEAAAQGVACAVTGILCHPLLVMVGFDPGSAAGGLVGCLMAQTLLPKSPAEPGTRDFRRDLWQTAGVTLGSVLFAAFVNPVLAAVVIDSLHSTRIPDGNVRALCAVLLGAFAQPIAVWARSVALPSLLRRLKLFLQPDVGGGDGPEGGR